MKITKTIELTSKEIFELIKEKYGDIQAIEFYTEQLDDNLHISPFQKSYAKPIVLLHFKQEVKEIDKDK